MSLRLIAEALQRAKETVQIFGCDGDAKSIAEAQAIMGDGGSALETARQVVDRPGNDGPVADRRQPLVRFAEVDWLRRHHDLQAGPETDHRIARNAEASDVMRTVLTSPSGGRRRRSRG